MLKVTEGRGFHLKFANGWTASVQFGPGNYCEHHHRPVTHYPVNSRYEHGSVNAEVAAWDENDNWYAFKDGNTVDGWLGADDVLAFLNAIANLSAGA